MFTISLEKNPKLCPLWNCSTCILQRCLRAPCLSHLHLLSVPSHQVIIKLWPHLGSCSHRSHWESPIIEDTLKSYCDCSHLKHRCNMSVTLCYTPMLPLPLTPITKLQKPTASGTQAQPLLIQCSLYISSGENNVAISVSIYFIPISSSDLRHK